MAKKAEWLAFFPLRQLSGEGDREAMERFLTERLRAGNKFAFKEDTLRISSSTKDEVFKAAIFISHENPLNRRLFYTVRGYDEDGKTVLDTSQKARLPGTPSLTDTAKVLDGGRITLPREMRIRLNLVEGDSVTLSLDGQKIVVSPAWRKK